MASTSSTGSVEYNPWPPAPALLTNRSTGRAGSRRRASTVASDGGSHRSATSVSTSTAWVDASSAARASSRSRRRATITRSEPSAASRRAKASPMPLEAPVTSATGHLAPASRDTGFIPAAG